MMNNIGYVLGFAVLFAMGFWLAEILSNGKQELLKKIAAGTLTRAFNELGVEVIELTWNKEGVAGLIKQGDQKRAFGVIFKRQLTTAEIRELAATMTAEVGFVAKKVSA